MDESDLLLPKNDFNTDPPKDRLSFVYIIFYLLGVGTLLPWNFFSNAKQYFMYKLRNTTDNSTLNDDSGVETELQIMFESYLTLAAMIPNVLFMYINTAATHYIRVKVRILLAAFVMIFMFAFAISLTRINTDSWQLQFFGLTLATIIIMNAGSAVLQGAIFGLSGTFPKEYTQAVMGGMGMGGTIAASANIIAISIGTNPPDSGFGYFLCAELVLIIAVMGYLLLPLSNFSRYYCDEIRKRSFSQSINTSTDVTSSSDTNTIDASSDLGSTVIVTPLQHSSILQIFKIVWMYATCVFITFFITLSCYPSVNSAIVSFADPTGLWAKKYFMPVSCFLIFNVFDWFGRGIAGPLQWPREGSLLIPLLCFLRLFFIPLFMLCNVQPRSHFPVLFYHDAIPMVLMVLFAISNGYLGTICMMYGPRQVRPEDLETTGSLMSFFLSGGLGAGSILAIGLVKLV